MEKQMSTLLQQIDEAFHFRGDVTLDMKDGNQVEGYLFNRDFTQQTLQLFLKDQTTPVSFGYKEITAIHLTGENTAAGKSWADWKAKQAVK